MSKRRFQFVPSVPGLEPRLLLTDYPPTDTNVPSMQSTLPDAGVGGSFSLGLQQGLQSMLPLLTTINTVLTGSQPVPLK